MSVDIAYWNDWTSKVDVYTWCHAQQRPPTVSSRYPGLGQVGDVWQRWFGGRDVLLHYEEVFLQPAS